MQSIISVFLLTVALSPIQHQTLRTVSSVRLNITYLAFSFWDTAIRAVTYIVFCVVLPALAVQDTCGLPKGRCRRSCLNSSRLSGFTFSKFQITKNLNIFIEIKCILTVFFVTKTCSNWRPACPVCAYILWFGITVVGFLYKMLKMVSKCVMKWVELCIFL